MNTPIKREDIRKGDRIRSTYEYTAEYDNKGLSGGALTYELIERPVQLPTEPGVYADKDGDIWRLDGDGLWRITDFKATHTETHAPFTLLRPVAEVAAEVLADVKAELPGTFAAYDYVFAGIAAGFDVQP